MVEARVLFAVALGGAIGAVLRHLLGAAVATEAFPWGTLAVNGIGSFLLAFLLFHHVVSGILPPTLRAFVSIGVLGAFTTMSTFSHETLLLHDAGEHVKAGLNIVGNLVLSLGGALLGRALALLLVDAHVA